MKFKKLTSLLLAAAMVVSVTACGNSEKAEEKTAEDSTTVQAEAEGDTASAEAGKEGIVVWTLADDLKQFAEQYSQKTGVPVDVQVIAPADYTTKLTSALGARSSEVDVIVGEPQMLPNFFEAGFFADLSALDADAQNAIVDYVYEAGKDESGTLRALSYQVTPGSVIYRRDLAKEIFGTDDPAEIGKKFENFDSILTAANEIKDAGYRIFSDTGNLRWFAGTDDTWVVDGTLNVGQMRMDYMDAAVNLYQNELVAFAPEWSAAWYASMAGELPLNAGWNELADVESTEMTQVFSYCLPSWGALIIRDNAQDNKGNFGVCEGPTPFFGGGTFLGVSEFSEKKETAEDFVRFCTLNEETAQWWLEASDGDVVSNKAVLEANKDYENESFGNQKTYAFYMEQAQNIDYSTVTKYDDDIKNLWGAAIEAVQRGEMTKEEAIEDFYMQVETTYPEIQVNR